MTRNGLICMFAAALACAIVTPAHAQQPTEARIHELIKLAAEKVAGGSADVQQPAVTSPTRK